MHRALRILNILIAVLAVAAIAFVYWFGWRPLPKTSGAVTAPVSAEARIARDEYGVAHITAANIPDALFLQGYVTAQDRLWQMDALRRVAAGEISEVIGAAGLDLDRESRHLRLRHIAESHARSMSPADRALIGNYVRGVNHFLVTHLKQLPVEFTLLGYDPRPWTISDTLLVGLQMYRTLTSNWKNELQKQEMLAAGDPAKVQFLYPLRTGRELQPGSNAWAIAGKYTASGKPLLANDPHLEWGLPSTWYMVHLKAPGLNVTGVSLPGVPGVIIGHNERIAWGVTNLQADVQDLYLEKLNPLNGQYEYNGRVEQATLEREIIRVKGAEPVETAVWITRHGPVFTNQNGRLITIRWAAAEPGSFQYPFVDLNRAGTWQEFRAALKRFPGPGQNFVYADVDGNIGYQATGRLPVRRAADGDVPSDGASGKAEWDGFIPFEELPSAFNPPGGMVITANQNPFPVAFPYRVNGNFASPYRSRQIEALLKSRGSLKPEDMLAIQKDVYSSFSHFLARETVAAYEKRGLQNPMLREPAALLKDWNGQMEKGMAAPFLATLLYQHLRRAVANRAAPGKGLAYDSPMATPSIERLLRERPKDWFDNYDQLLLRVFVDAVEEASRIQGRNARKWVYGSYLDLTIAHPVGSRIPWIGKYFQIGPVQMSGSATTVKQTTQRIGPSMRFVADLSNWDRSLNNITAGQSGHLLSSHFKDQWPLYYSGRSLPMMFETVREKDVLIIRPGN